MLVGIAFMPGMPVMPPLVLVAALGAFYMLSSKRRTKNSAEAEDGAAKKDEDDPYEQATVEPVEMLLGGSVASMLGGDEKNLLLERVGEFRKQFATEMGFVLPKVRFKDAPLAQANHYEIAMYGDVVATGSVLPGHLLAIHPSGNTNLVPGIETKDPSYGLPALWIEPNQREAARAAKYTLVDTTTVLVTHLSETLRLQAAALLTRTEADRMLARLRVAQPGLVEELVPTQLSVGDVQKVLQGLMKEKVPVRNLQAIVETLIDAAKLSKDPGLLVEFVRQRLATTICNALSPDKKVLHVLTLHPELEGQLLQTVAGVDATRVVQIDPRLTETVLLKLAQQAERMLKSSMTPVVLCPVELRRHLRSLSERAIPHLRVLSVAEIPIQFELRAFASVSLT
jgi:flagellar biosynthesis protein FlhA